MFGERAYFNLVLCFSAIYPDNLSVENKTKQNSSQIAAFLLVCLFTFSKKRTTVAVLKPRACAGFYQRGFVELGNGRPVEMFLPLRNLSLTDKISTKLINFNLLCSFSRVEIYNQRLNLASKSSIV